MAHPLTTGADHGDPLVLGRRPLRSGVSRASTSRYSTDVWDLSPAQLLPSEPGVTVDFRTLPPVRTPLAKQLIHAMIAGPFPADERPHRIASIRSIYVEVRRFLSWLDEHRPGQPVADVVPDDLEEYCRQLHTVLRTAGARRTARAAVRLFWRYRHCLDDPLSFDPLHELGSGEPHPRRAENTTPRLPEDVLAPLLSWSLRVVRKFAADVLHATSSGSRTPRPNQGTAQRAARTSGSPR